MWSCIRPQQLVHIVWSKVYNEVQQSKKFKAERVYSCDNTVTSITQWGQESQDHACIVKQIHSIHIVEQVTSSRDL